jgi:hypothetical protein
MNLQNKPLTSAPAAATARQDRLANKIGPIAGAASEIGKQIAFVFAH